MDGGAGGWRGGGRVGIGGEREGRCEGRERSGREERERERQQISPRLTLPCLTPRGSLTGRGLNMTITAAPPHKVPFPVCFVFYGDGPASHRSS